jgi:lysozyme
VKEQLVKQLRRDEGERLSAYRDHLGYWTIGVGILIDDRKGGAITPEESAYLLNNRIEDRMQALEKALPWVKDLDEARLGVLLNMSYQLGVKGLLGFKNTLEMIRKGQYQEAADGMLQSLWAQQTPQRALRLSEQMRTGVWK